jgi:hypothetical protein
MFRSWKRCAAVGVLLMYCALPVLAQVVRSSAAKGINELAAPVPTPLLNGKRAFISYEQGDVTAFPDGYSGGPERAYSEFFALMKLWGRFELVMDPKDADLVFGIRFVNSPGLMRPQIRIGISDAKTHVALWGFVEEVDPAIFKKHRDASFSESVQWLVTDIQTLLAPDATGPAATGPATTGPTAQKSGKTRLSDQAR